MEGRLPGFICIGAQKSGTTTLHKLLIQHPDFFLPKQKELHFFDKQFEKGIEWYKNNFVTEKYFIGEITPSYAYAQDCATRIFDTLGPVKIILIMRNPVDRAYSHYLMSKRRGYETLDFIDAVSQESERIGHNDFNSNHFSYITRSRYASQIKEYKKYFNDNLYICDFDDLKDNQELFLNQLLDFLGAPAHPAPNHDIKGNPAREFKSKWLKTMMTGKNPFLKILKKMLGKSLSFVLKQKILKHGLDSENIIKLSAADRNYVRTAFFQEEIRKVEAECGRTFPNWHE